MKKGDQRRNAILEAAEKLFFEKGYEQTSIQDVLDALAISKGGFYHYFASKEIVLQEICENRMQRRLEGLSMELYGVRTSPTDKLNLLLSLTQLFERDSAAFAALMLKICYLDGDVRIRDHVRKIVIEQLAPHMDEVIAAGTVEGAFFTRHPAQIGRMILMMACDVDDEVCRMLAEQPDNPDCLLEIADLLNAFRDAVEMLLGARFGSIVLFDPAKLVSDHRAAAAELIRMEECGR